jgi:hypothetical protein
MHAVYVILERMLIQTASALLLTAALATAATPAAAQSYEPAKARRHFVSIFYGTQFVQPMGFANHPLEELLGQEVHEVHLESFQYRTEDGQTLVNVLEYGKRGTELGVTVYPLGSRVGATLAIRGSIETLPDIRASFTGPAPFPTYELTGGRAYDVGVGVEVADRAPGFGLGAHAFLIGGAGRVHTDQLDGRRYFIEGGGGVMSGPFGVDLSFKYTINTFTTPVTHSVHMIPISVRGTLSF